MAASDGCLCMTASDLGYSGWGDGINPNMIAHKHPKCPIHGVIEVPLDLWAHVRSIPSDRLPTVVWEAIQALGRKGESQNGA